MHYSTWNEIHAFTLIQTKKEIHKYKEAGGGGGCLFLAAEYQLINIEENKEKNVIFPTPLQYLIQA